MSTLDDWTDALCAELGLDPADAGQKTVLNLARVVAHTVDRPAGRAYGDGGASDILLDLERVARK